LQTRVERVAAESGGDLAAAARKMAQALGVARFGAPAEIGRVVALLASPQSAYCHGAIVDVDGGQTRTL
jgi:3-oxoacyl-[acyl-carrier protein] reductase